MNDKIMEKLKRSITKLIELRGCWDISKIKFELYFILGDLLEADSDIEQLKKENKNER